MSWFRRKSQPPMTRWRLYHFMPKPNISAYELATILGNTWSMLGGTIADGVYLPADKTAEETFQEFHEMPELARHFVATDQIDEFPASWF